jgi:hypothetical protein
MLRMHPSLIAEQLRRRDKAAINQEEASRMY